MILDVVRNRSSQVTLGAVLHQNTSTAHTENICTYISFLATLTMLCIMENSSSSLSYPEPPAIHVLFAAFAFLEAVTAQM